MKGFIKLTKAELFFRASAVAALLELYRDLNFPAQLKGWKREGGDPCEESWTGISCSGSSVIFIQLHGLQLGGNLGGQLSNLLGLQELDVSGNNIQGEIPFSVPPNATYLNLACNNFRNSIPSSLNSMKRLRHLNLSHNYLSGPIGNVFTDLQSVRQMDLSYNNFSGDLPSSFGDLKNLLKLFLQNNKFTGSVIFLANLPLSDLNIQNNHFSGVIPKQFQLVPNLWIGGNMFHEEANYPPWDFPWDNLPTDQNINAPPTTQSTAIESYPYVRESRLKHKRLSPGGIAFMLGVGTLLATCAAVIITIHINQSRSCKLGNLKRDDTSLQSLPISTTAVDRASNTPEEMNAQSLACGSSPMINSWRRLSVHRTEEVRRSFTGSTKSLPIAKQYTLAEIQSATNNFREENLLGEGSLGSVYKAEFPDGQVLVVKSIKTVQLSLCEEEQFLDVIWKVARLRHPNIIMLLGYCMEHGQHLLVYEYVRNLSLDDILHSAAYTPLSWSLRVRIALGIARALDYLHTSCFPPCPHCNLKAANILLDDDLMPRLCDCGLAILRSLTSNTVKLKASEMAISCTGYIAPEHGQSRVDNRKSDIYAFGVLLLELLTGRKPFDNSRSSEEQCLVKWASLHLHDNMPLEEMVDPTIKRVFSSKALARLVDIISLCIQPDPEFRPPMSEIVDSLVSSGQLMSIEKRNLADGNEVEASERSFLSADSCFVSSPLTSHASI